MAEGNGNLQAQGVLDIRDPCGMCRNQQDLCILFLFFGDAVEGEWKREVHGGQGHQHNKSCWDHWSSSVSSPGTWKITAYEPQAPSFRRVTCMPCISQYIQ
jgi:hypothetical protein